MSSIVLRSDQRLYRTFCLNSKENCVVHMNFLGIFLGANYLLLTFSVSSAILTRSHRRRLLFPLDLSDNLRSLLDLLFHLLECPLLLPDRPEPNVALLITQHPVWLHSDK